jgi:methionine synthase II (cobalamin-independent)
MSSIVDTSDEDLERAGKDVSQFLREFLTELESNACKVVDVKMPTLPYGLKVPPELTPIKFEQNGTSSNSALCVQTYSVWAAALNHAVNVFI